jgi:hypothetical protein
VRCLVRRETIVVDQREQDEGQEVAAVQVVDDLSGDYLLRSFAALAQQGVVNMGITLNVAGSIVSGRLIGRDEWFDLAAEEAAQVGEGSAAFMGAVRDNLKTAVARDEAENEDGSAQYGFLHLRDAALDTGNGLTEPFPVAGDWQVRDTPRAAR